MIHSLEIHVREILAQYIYLILDRQSFPFSAQLDIRQRHEKSNPLQFEEIAFLHATIIQICFAFVSRR